MFNVKLFRRIHSVAPSSEDIEEARARGLTWQIRSQGTYNHVGKTWCHATYQTELPFAPFPGLRLDVSAVGTLHPLVKVEWRSHSNSKETPHFFCIYEDDYPTDRQTYEKMRAAYTAGGWKVVEFGPGINECTE